MRGLRVVERAHSFSENRIKAAGAAVANGGAGPEARSHEAFTFEAIERRLDGAGGDVALQPRRDLVQDRASIRVVVEPHDRQQHCLFERAENLRQRNYIVVIFAAVSNPRNLLRQLAPRVLCREPTHLRSWTIDASDKFAGSSDNCVTPVALERPTTSSSIIDVLDHVLDKGIVIDAWVRVSLIGVDLVTIEARVVVASIATYLKHAGTLAERPSYAIPSR